MAQQAFAQVNKQAQVQKPQASCSLQRERNNCRKKKRNSEADLDSEKMQSIMDGALHTPATPPGSPRQNSAGQSFGYDFSQIPVHSSRASIQAKLTVNTPGDIYEQEADRIADLVMATSAQRAFSRVSPRIQRLAEQPTGYADTGYGDSAPVTRSVKEVEDEDGGSLGISGSGMEEARGHRETVKSASELTAGGSVLSYPLRAFYEGRLGYDLGAVRIHTGRASEHLNDSLQARALTYNSHIWLGSGERLAPSFCLAHELVHTIQQSRPPRIERHYAEEAGPEDTPRYHALRPLVQRKETYWVPKDDYRRKYPGNIGQKIQDRIYTDSTAPGLRMEVNIPNAARKKGFCASGAECGLHVKFGRADLYLADGGKPIGVYFSESATEINPENLRQPARLGGKKAPQVEKNKISGKNEIKDIDKGPKWVRIGEIKPASIDGIKLGKDQVENYIYGIKTARKWTNAWSAAMKKKTGREWGEWKDGDISPLTDDDFKPKASYTFNPLSPQKDEELVLDTNPEDKPIGTLRPLMDPQEVTGQKVMGGLYVHYYGEGVWGYFARPENPEAAVGLPGLTEKNIGDIRLAQTLQRDVVDQFTGAAIIPMALHKPGARRRPRITKMNEQGRVQRAIKAAPRVRDTFSLPKVKAARRKLHGQLKAQEKTKPFKRLEFLELAYEADESLDPQLLAGSKRLPDKNKLAVELKTGDVGPATKKAKGLKPAETVKRPLATLNRWMNLWTHPSIDILAGIREALGTTFVTISNKARGFKDKIGQKLSQTFGKHASSGDVGTSYKAVAIRAIGRALKAVGKILIPQTLRLVVESLIGGVKERLLKVLPLDIDSLEKAVEGEFNQFNPLLARIEGFKASIDNKILEIEEKFGELLSGLKELLALASKVTSTIKWAVRAVQCLTPPGWGCLKLVFSSLTAFIAEKVLNYCPLQKDVACLVSDIGFVKKGIPMAIADAIGGGFNSALSEVDPNLSPLFKELKDEHVPPIDCNEIGCEGEFNELDAAYSALEKSLVEKHGVLGAAKMMDALLEMTRVFGPEEGEGLDAAEVDKLRKMLELYDVDPAELELIVEGLKQKKKEGKEVRHATVEEFGDAIERHREEMRRGSSGEPAAGGAEGAGEGEKGIEGGSGETAPDGVEAKGEGLATDDFSNATFRGKRKGDANGTLIAVENPDLVKHTKGSHKIILFLSIKGIPVKRVTNVPVYIPKRVWRDARKTEMTIHYKLLEGVSFTHGVPSYPSLIVLEKGQVVPMPVKNPRMIKSQEKKSPEVEPE